MDSKRITLYTIFFLATFYLWQQWDMQHHPKQVPVTDAGGTATALAEPAQTNKLLHGQTVHVRTDVIDATIDTVGGDIRTLHLLKYGALNDKKQPFQVLDDGKDHIYIAQTGFLNDDLPKHSNVFSWVSTVYGKDGVTVTLRAQNKDADVLKKLIFQNGSYVVNVQYQVHNTSAQAEKPIAYFKLLRDGKEIVSSTRGGSGFTGPALFTDAEKYYKVPFKKLDPDSNGDNAVQRRVSDGWVAMVQHYFTSAWLLNQMPDANGSTLSLCQKRACNVTIKKNEQPLEANGKVFNDTYAASVTVEMDTIAPGHTDNLVLPLFVGPEDHQVFDASPLHELAPDLYLTKDYGWQRVIAEPLFLVLVFLHKLVANWGVAIVCLTLLIKAAFFPLSRASYRSMAKMKKLMPRMQELKELHGDDKMKYQQSVMELYKAENANPMGGCLPILIQIPVFLALYSVLQSAVELRQAPFFGWIQDLSLSDPYYVLPAILAVTMYAQTLLNPPPTDPVQAKMMKIMPLVFSAMFFLLPVGLVVYYIVNNLLSILQQWYVNRQIEV